ncbi:MULTISPECIES: molybdopterin-synthase adenylyltransferase MoeB [Pseudovibrio]|uniref:molybdopterin-synthase adenylyltransferase MoeB n=1 Tax=Stappiaceae TaxID=2821832 RepID=UPI002365F8D7|nr:MULTISPECIES: molybdopterin-synthase adenylyltransferase MoeB [Pseudovibrio]MDD7909567.1 molybdopterin-synthase adenylyltransferase MoeB [Pseudovibrio exalbescens]MDX5595080.1 molybdopterin-synthase adenylyltransferase MoeB [Pseudovibrio sp. SPO723]
MLSPAELERYARHIVLKGVGGPGQQKLKDAKVLVIGAGGLGAPVLQYLAAAGVGTLGILDDDVVSLSNLQRQIIHDTDQLGEPKVASAAETIARLNPYVQVRPHPTRFSGQNAMALVSSYDLVVDGSDNFETRYLASDACYFAKKPLVTGAVGQFDGSVTLLKPYETDAEGAPNPTYRCLFPKRPAAGSIPTCEEAGVLGALTGVIGSLQALEAIKEIVGFGEGLVGRLLLADTAVMRFETITYKHNPANPLNGDAPKSWAEMLELDL